MPPLCFTPPLSQKPFSMIKASHLVTQNWDDLRLAWRGDGIRIKWLDLVQVQTNLNSKQNHLILIQERCQKGWGMRHFSHNSLLNCHTKNSASPGWCPEEVRIRIEVWFKIKNLSNLNSKSKFYPIHLDMEEGWENIYGHEKTSP